MPVLGYENMASQDMCLMGYNAEYILPAPPSWEKAQEHAYSGYLCRTNLESPNSQHSDVNMKYTEGLLTQSNDPAKFNSHVFLRGTCMLPDDT